MTTSPEIIAMELGTFRFPEPELAHRQGVVMAYAIRHRGGVFLFDTGLGFGNEELDERYHPVARRIDEALAEVGLAIDDVTAVANCHLHADHSGQNLAFPDVPIYVQGTEWEIAHTTDHTILEWIDFPAARYIRLAGDHEPIEGLRIVATPGHTAGHQSLAVETEHGLVLLAGQAVYTADEWAGEPDELEGRSGAPDRDAYDRSLERLHGLDPAVVHFGHDRRSWRRRG
ncbi:MAG TPA: N-acyl homoserine lactonase family protein [Candidatus Limnocylindrales bacterium]|nr:N-acyl homoserine lactonase family protein [Candidatus Limnocylindrales bacterium]